MTAAEDPYRAAPPCAECAARGAAKKLMQPFCYPSERECPECGNDEPLWWPGVCNGGGEKFNELRTVITMFSGKAELVFTCDLESPPKHFHFECRECHTRWAMLAKSEASSD